jgi:Lipocalin-like domain
MRTVMGWVVLGAGLAIGAAVTSAQAPSSEAQVRQQLVGAYKLVWYDTFDRNGAVTRTPYTVGQIAYDAAGRMSAQLMRSERPKFAGAQPTEAERAAAHASFISYFGRYELDVQKKTVTHYVEGDLSPNAVGSVRVRHFQFSPDGKSLFLEVREGDRVVGRLQWDRYR